MKRFYLFCTLAAIAGRDVLAQTNTEVSQQSNAGGKAQSNSFTIIGAMGQPAPPGRATSEQHVILGGFINLFDVRRSFALSPPVPLDTPRVGNDLTFVITPPPNFQATERQLFYRLAGQTPFQSTDLQTSGTQLEGTIPPNFLTIRGAEYYVRLFDGQIEVTFPAFDPINLPAILRVQIDRLAYPDTLPAQAHRMISIPLSLQKIDVDSVLQDDYGPYDFLVRRWRLFRWQNGRYAEHLDIDARFTPGTAFWLITRTGEPFDVEQAQSVISSGDFSLALAPGFNQIANPFAFPVAWSDVGGSTQAQAPVRWDVEQKEYQYNQTLLQPFEGYFVFNLAADSVTLSVPPVEFSDEGEGNLAKSESWPRRSEKEFALQIKARGGQSGWKDQQNFVGMLNGATNELDHLDFLEAPPFGEDYLRLSIVAAGLAYAGNFHALSPNGSFWDLQLSTTGRKEQVHLALVDHEKLPAGFQIWLLDQDRQSALALHGGETEVRVPEGAMKSLRLIVGTPELADQANDGIPLVPYQFALRQNYPNPFNRSTERSRRSPETRIEYELAERSDVRLEIFNLLGQKIRILINATQSAGTYAARWDGADDRGHAVSSGIYLYRLKAGEFTAVRKLVLNR